MDWSQFASYALSGIIVWGVGQLNYQMRKANEWRKSVDRRLDQIEQRLRLGH